LDRNAFQILLDSAFAPDAALQRLIETAAKAWRPSSEAGTPAKVPLASATAGACIWRPMKVKGLAS
jgi:hypothetical protein